MKRLIALLAAGLGLLACTKEAPVAETATQPLKFNITVTLPDGAATKAVKTGWEDGDVVFVFFSEAPAPYYLEMKYNAETDSWTSTQKNAAAEEEFDLTEGTMTAVFLPFGNDAHLESYEEGIYSFSKMYYSYFLKAEKQAYSVEDGVVYGNLEMQLPDGFVQFFADAPSATAERAARSSLWESHVAPAGVESIAADGTVNVKVRNYGSAMPAYYYDNGTDPRGFHFSGILKEDVRGVATAYTFHINLLGNNYATASGTKTLYTADSRALKLPDSGSEVWQTDPHPAIDLGLDVKWALTNVGAETPEEYGDYFAWGETEPYYESIAEDGTVTWKAGMSEGYAWSTYFDTEDGGNTFKIYATDKKTELEAADDAATANWGESWRMPTDADWEELLDKCTKEWKTMVNGYAHNGYLFTGPNNNTLFLPAAGHKGDISENTGSDGYYWSSSLHKDFSDNAWYVRFISAGIGGTDDKRNYGFSVRPVCD